MIAIPAIIRSFCAPFRPLIRVGLLSPALTFLNLAAIAEGQVTIFWNSDASATNLTSLSQPMDGGFRFELGVFSGSFVPTLSNIADWAANWNPATQTSETPPLVGRTYYNAGTKRYAASFVVDDNTAPFTVGKAAYVWGFRGTPQQSDWILFRKSSSPSPWVWPNGGTFPPTSINWFAKDATAVIGTIKNVGSPLMQSAAVTNARPPDTPWTVWRDKMLGGNPLNGPNDDPDADGARNALEFAFGTDPLSPLGVPPTPASFTHLSDSDYLTISIPRRIDHLANLTVQISPDLVSWNSGPSHTTTVSSSLATLIVRDLTPRSSSQPRRFMRVLATVP